jgi:hypothetical protein
VQYWTTNKTAPSIFAAAEAELIAFAASKLDQSDVRPGCDPSGMSRHLRHDLELLHQGLLKGKLPRSLKWNDAIELVEHLGKVQPHGAGEYAFEVGSHREFFKKPHSHELGVDEVSRLRHFLRGPEHESTSSIPMQPCRMVVVIDHQAAHIYQDINTSRPQDEVTIKPYDPFGFRRHLLHRKEAHYKGEHVPEEASYYDAIAEDLVPANEIVLIGHGTGKSNAANHLAEYLKAHHSQVFQHVLATEIADLSALTEPQIEELAKQHMIAVV